MTDVDEDESNGKENNARLAQPAPEKKDKSESMLLVTKTKNAPGNVCVNDCLVRDVCVSCLSRST